jgi:hypothetical protein
MIAAAAGAEVGAQIGLIGGPLGAVAGAVLGGLIGLALGVILVDQIQKANDHAEEETQDSEQAQPCIECGEIDCFTPPEGADLGEFRRQLKEQEDAINNSDPKDLIERIDNYAANKRPADDAKMRRKAREEYKELLRDEIKEEYAENNKTPTEEDIDRDVKTKMSKLAATHVLDLVAGGDGTISGLGDRSINSSIGSQWRGKRVQQLREHADNAQKKGKKINVKLEEC